jgi:hypothetical protein
MVQMKTNKKITQAMATLEESRIFPLQTIQSMSKRWGVTNQVLNNWRLRHSDFPKEIVGLVEKTPGLPRLFPLYEVEAYERVRGLGGAAE